jgi:hypothetical protein
MSTPSYSTFVRRHAEAHRDRRAEAERVADAAPDWMDLMARGLTDAVSAPLRFCHPTAAESMREQPL